MPNIAGPGKRGFLLLSLSVALVSVPSAVYGEDQATTQGDMDSARNATPTKGATTLRSNAGGKANSALGQVSTTRGKVVEKTAIFDRWGNSLEKSVAPGTNGKVGGTVGDVQTRSRMSANEASASGALKTGIAPTPTDTTGSQNLGLSGEANNALQQVSTTRGKAVGGGKDPVGPAGAPVVTSRSNKRGR